jgi:DpnII restriction endonuclease
MRRGTSLDPRRSTSRPVSRPCGIPRWPHVCIRYGDYGRAKARDGRAMDIRGCLASFYADGLEALVCGRRYERYEELPEMGTQDNIALVMRILNNLNVTAHSLAHRQRSRPAFAISNEYDLQDLLFAQLRAVFDDARKEEWTPQSAGSAKRIDFVLPASGIVLEAKFVRDRKHANRIADELRVDFECYHAHERCRHLVALVWDPDRHIADPIQFCEDLSGLRQKDSASFNVSVLVR